MLIVVGVEHLERGALAVVIDLSDALPERVIAGELATAVREALHLETRVRAAERGNAQQTGQGVR
jgi:hypothetical protein